MQRHTCAKKIGAYYGASCKIAGEKTSRRCESTKQERLDEDESTVQKQAVWKRERGGIMKKTELEVDLVPILYAACTRM